MVRLILAMVTLGTYGRGMTDRGNIPQTQALVGFEPTTWNGALQRPAPGAAPLRALLYVMQHLLFGGNKTTLPCK